MSMLNIAQIIIAVMVVVVILAQVRGGGLGGIFGGSGESAFKTRRGVERTLFRFTVILSIVFIILSILSVRFA
ncbi:MAG TPA: preprotein translocase subunit SecG [Dehalococcoidia bacterium]|nr:preprotein translocase subunit SecG [Dehalococcoidia bacterium]